MALVVNPNPFRDILKSSKRDRVEIEVMIGRSVIVMTD